MSIVEEFRRDECRVLDRLVDGELGQAERCELLAALDDEPGAWRRCALAFLESQNMRWQLTRLAADSALAETRRAQAASYNVPLVRRGSFWGVCLSVAAGLLIAFGLGTRYAAVPAGATPNNLQVAAEEPATDPNAEASVETDLGEVEDPLDTVTLAPAAGEEGENIELPVAVADADESQWLDELNSGLPADLLERLRAAGMDVVRSQRLFPVDLSDGRRLVVPVEQVDIRHSGFNDDL